jgi:hypothetical protein
MRKKRKPNSQLVRHSETPEDALWRNVILQAIEDATWPLPATCETTFSKNMARIREQAREWVAQQGKDFHAVCSLAGLEASRVHTFAMERIRKAIQADHDRIATENFLKGSIPGVVENFADGSRDRLTQSPQDSAKIDFPQNRNLTPCP